VKREMGGKRKKKKDVPSKGVWPKKKGKREPGAIREREKKGLTRGEGS